MEKISANDLSQLEKIIPSFKEEFSSGIQRTYDDDEFILREFTLGDQNEGFLYFNFDYQGQCSLFPGDGKHTGKVKVSELASSDDFFEKAHYIIALRVKESFIKVR